MRSLWLALALVSCGDAKPTPAAPVSSASVAASSSAPIASREDATLPPRSIFFGNPDRTRVRISPANGAKLAYLANENGVLNVFVGDTVESSKAVTHATKNVRKYEWSMDGKTILYFDGDENAKLRAVAADGKNDRELLGHDGASVEIVHLSAKRPGEVVVGINDRDKRFHDLYVVDVVSGRKTLLQKNDGFERFVVDDDFRARFGVRARPDGGAEIEEPNGAGWKNFTTIPPENRATTEIVDFDKSETTLYMLDSRGRNTAALVTVDLKTKKSTVVLDDGAADIEFVLVHPSTKAIEAVEANYDRTRWHVIDKTAAGDVDHQRDSAAVDSDFDYLRTVAHGDLGITSRTLDDKKWLVAFATEGPTRYYVYDREAHAATFLFVSHDALANVVLSTMTPLTIKARDGVDLVTYVTLPAAKTPSPPLVALVHAAKTRDSYGFSPTAQWLASRGYAVLQVNYRAAKMRDDVIDAVKWVESQNFSDAHRVAIFGHDAQATLAAAPDLFSCAVDIAGSSATLRSKNSVTQIAFPDEGQKILRPENRKALSAVAEIFLAQSLGGAYQPIVASDFSSSSITVPSGKENIRGLADTLH